MSFKFPALLLAGALACVGLAVNATAGSNPSAVYTALTPNVGHLVVSGPAGSNFVVRGEQPDGTYQVIWIGVVGACESTMAVVPHTGPTTNGQPQYIVTLRTPTPEIFTLLGTDGDPEPKNDPDDIWWED